jgi:hypothetical protein
MALDFFPVGSTGGKVYTDKSCTIGDLKQSIRQEIAAITADVLQREFTNFEHRRLENIDQYIINKNS